MKRILLICSLLVATTYTVTYAQAQQTTPTAVNRPTPVSKSDFTSKASELNKLIGKGKMDEAHTLYNEIDLMMGNSFRVGKYKIKDARDANDEPKANNIISTLKNQRNIYNDVQTLAAGDMSANKSKIYDKLQEFAALMD